MSAAFSLRLIASLLLGITITARADALCPGDCNGDNNVTIDNVVLAVNIALATAPLAACEVLDENHDGRVTVDEIVRAVNSILHGCALPSRTPTASPTPIVVGPLGERASLFMRCATFADGSTGLCHFFTSRNETFRPLVFPQPFQVSNLHVFCVTPVATGSQRFTVNIAGVDTGLQCTVTGGGDSCEDSDPQHAQAYLPPQLFSVRVAGDAGASNPTCALSLSVTTSGGQADAIFNWEAQNEFSPVAGRYCGPGVGLTNDASACGVSAAADAAWTVGSPGHLSGFAVRANAPLTTNTAATFQICKLGIGDGSCTTAANGATGVTVTIDDRNEHGLDTSCSDNCELAAGDRLVVLISTVVGSPGPKKTHFVVTVDGVPAHLAFRGPRSNDPRYYNVMFSSPSRRPTLYRIDRAGVLRNLRCNASSIPRFDTSFSVCAGPSDSAPCSPLTCTMTSAQTVCGNVSDAVPVAAGDFVTFLVGRSGADGFHGCSVEIAPAP